MAGGADMQRAASSSLLAAETREGWHLVLDGAEGRRDATRRADGFSALAGGGYY